MENTTASLEWPSEWSKESQPDEDNVTAFEFESSTEPYCQVCSHVKTLPKNLFVLQLFFPALTLAANLLTTVAIYRSRQMKLSLRLSLLHLSFTDIVSSVFYMYNIAFSWTQFKVNVECVVRYIVFVFTQILNISTIHFMSIDRAIALMAPYLYNRLSHSKHIKILTAANWTICFVVVTVGFSHLDTDAEGCFYPLLFRPFTHMFWASTGLMVISSIVILNTLFFLKARREIRKIATTMPVGEARDREISRMGIKSAMTTVYVVVPYVLLNTPIYALMVVFVQRGSSFTRHSSALYLINAFSSLNLLNSLVNPAVYIWRSEMVRDQIWQILEPLKVLVPARCGNCKRETGERGREMANVQQVSVESKRPSNSTGPSGEDKLSTRPSLDVSARVSRDFMRNSEDNSTRTSQVY